MDVIAQSIKNGEKVYLKEMIIHVKYVARKGVN